MAIPFPFTSDLALRIANLITQDIERLEKDALGTATPWQSRFAKPYKAHYGEDIARRIENETALGNTAPMDKAVEVLPRYEKHATDYMAQANRRGRPLSTFYKGPAREQQSEATPQIKVERSAQRVEEDSAPVAPEAKPTPDATHIMDTLVTREGVDVDAALAALKDVLTRPTSAEVSPALIYKIVREELAKSGALPLRVEVKLPNSETIKDMGVQHSSFPALLRAVTSFPVWLPGPAGSGKTTAARNAATALGVPFHHHGAVDNVYQLLGFIDAGGNYHRTSFRNAYEHGGVFLWDEVDASNPAALVAFNAAIENGECVFPDATIARHAQCYFIAAANTYGTGATHEYVGRTKLDAATLDRFVMLDWPYDEILERAIAGDTTWTKYVQAARRACIAAGIKHLITPRASIRGNALLSLGLDASEVIAMTVRKGLSEDHWRTIERGAGAYHGA